MTVQFWAQNKSVVDKTNGWISDQWVNKSSYCEEEIHDCFKQNRMEVQGVYPSDLLSVFSNGSQRTLLDRGDTSDKINEHIWWLVYQACFN